MQIKSHICIRLKNIHILLLFNPRVFSEATLKGSEIELREIFATLRQFVQFSDYKASYFSRKILTQLILEHYRAVLLDFFFKCDKMSDDAILTSIRERNK